MNHILILLFINIIAQRSFGQTSNDTHISKKYLDSLKSQLSHQKERNNFLYWNYHLKTNVAKVDTAFIRPDSSVISYYLGNGNLLMQESAEYDNQNHKTFYIRRHYNEMERIVYVEHWVPINDSRFVAKMPKTERMEYDRLGRLILHVTYFATGKKRTERSIYWYDAEGNQHQTSNTVNEFKFWD